MEQDPLSQLRDIHIPAPGGIWPPAPGWWVLLALLIGAVVLVVWLVRRRRQRRQWYVAARRKMNDLANRAAVTPEWFSELNTLLKQSALKRYPDRSPESLTGSDWIQFLLDTSPKDRIASRPTVEAMVASCWQPTPSCAPDDAIRFARLWLGGKP